MNEQLDLFAWADSRPSNVIDAVPRLIRKAGWETMYQIPRPTGGATVTPIRRSA